MFRLVYKQVSYLPGVRVWSIFLAGSVSGKLSHIAADERREGRIWRQDLFCYFYEKDQSSQA